MNTPPNKELRLEMNSNLNALNLALLRAANHPALNLAFSKWLRITVQYDLCFYYIQNLESCQTSDTQYRWRKEN